MAADARRAAASLAADISWARTPNRTERTAPARSNSPTTYDYWLRKITDEGVVREADRPAAAANAHRAYMKQLSRKAAATRAANAAKKKASATEAA